MRGLWRCPQHARMLGALLLALTGCSSLFGLHEPAHGTGDAATDAIDAPTDGNMCVGRGAFAICLDAVPASAVTLPMTINTDDVQLCSTTAHWASPSQTAACMIVGTSVTQVGTSEAIGSRPLVVIATDVLQIKGTLEVSSSLVAGVVGAGANAGSCGSFASPPEPGSNGGGGGAGGSFASTGGIGGRGSSGVTLGGRPNPVSTTISVLRGGCRGEAGAPGGAPSGVPGDGGGAVYLVAGTQLALTGARVLANGGGAAAGANRTGGSGGGAGGMIVLDAPAISATNILLMANGGGGASGADANTGNDGQDPAPGSPLVPAPGGGAGRGGPGGAGAAATTAAVDGSDTPSGTSRGGGGGGGGIGLILAPQALSGATVSPPITMLP